MSEACSGFALMFALITLACGSGAGPGMDQPDAGAADAGPEFVAPIVCESVAGTRLSREHIEPVPGARQEFRIMDTQHDVECRYRAESNGTFTCYPALTSSSLFFQDSNCTSGLAAYPIGGEPRKFTRVTRASGDPCIGNIREFRSVGAASAVTVGQGIFRRNLAGTCVPILAPLRDYYVTSPLLTADDFVTANLEAFSAGSRVSTLTHVGSDGSGMCAHNLSSIDSLLDVDCRFGLGADELPYCMPTGGTSATFFLDAQCEMVGSTVTVDSCETAAPKYVVEDASVACGGTARSILQVTAQEVTERYQVNGALCESEPADPDSYYLIGDPVSVTEFASVATETELGDGRLQRQVLVTADRSARFENRWRDTKLEIDCEFRLASDGSLRCLPVPMTRTSYFSDLGCTIPITLALVDDCQAPPGFFSKPAAGGGSQIFAAEPYTQSVYDLVNGFCEEVQGTLYQETFEHAPSSFQLGEKVLQ